MSKQCILFCWNVSRFDTFWIFAFSSVFLLFLLLKLPCELQNVTKLHKNYVMKACHHGASPLFHKFYRITCGKKVPETRTYNWLSLSSSFQEISPARSKNHSYQCISKADPERESSSFSRMGITAALTFLVDYSKDNELWVFVCGLDRFKDKKLPDPK